MVELAIYTLIVNALLAFKLWWDYRAKKSGRIINHFQSATIDGLLYAVAAYFLFDLQLAISMFLFAVGYRWIFFDLIFNKINGWKWNHYGTSSKLDLFLAKCGKWHFLVKLIPIILGVLIIVL